MVVIIDNLVRLILPIGTGTLVQITAPAGRITVKPRNVNIANSSRGEILGPASRVHIRVVVNQWDIYAILAGRSFKRNHVFASRLIRYLFCWVAFPLFAVFVFDLINNRISSFRDKVLACDFRKLCKVRAPRICITRVIVAQLAIRTGRQP